MRTSRPPTPDLAADERTEGYACWVVGEALYHCGYCYPFHSRPQASKSRKAVGDLLDGVSQMDFSGAKHNTVMDNVYMGIIYAAQPDPVGNWVDQFRACVGAIVLLYCATH
jgi:hypothetical protein